MDMPLGTLMEAARKSGAVLLEQRARGLTTTDKGVPLGAHFFTQADVLSQECGIAVLKAAYPDEVIIAEEQEHGRSTLPPDCTVFDPFDGTTIGLNGCDEFGITLCTIRNGQPFAGVIYFPVLNEMIRAVRDQGCFINDQQIKIMPIDEERADKALLGNDIGQWTVYEVLRPLAQQWSIRSMMAAVYGARAVLLGQTQAYWNFNIAKIWDAAAGVLMVQEAGGVACDPKGNPLRWNEINCDWIIAASPAWRDRILEHSRPWSGR